MIWRLQNFRRILRTIEDQNQKEEGRIHDVYSMDAEKSKYYYGRSNFIVVFTNPMIQSVMVCSIVFRAVMLAGILSAVFCSCQSVRSINASAENVSSVGERPRAGNFYFLPKVLIHVKGRYLEDGTTFQISVSRELSPDKDARYFAYHSPSPLADDDVSFIVNSKGLIDGAFTSSSKDQTGDIIETLAKTAINVWKISSYGTPEGQLPAVEGLAGAGLADDQKLEPFDWVVDPYSDEATTGKDVGDFLVKVVRSKNSKARVKGLLPPVNQPLDREGGLVFRAPDVVDLIIERDSRGIVAGEPIEIMDKMLAGEGAGEDPVAAPPEVSEAQKSGDVFAWNIFNASKALGHVAFTSGVKTADPAPDAVVSFSLDRAPFVRKSFGLAFVDGELLGMNVVKPSEVKAAVDVPFNISAAVLEAIPSIIEIKDSRVGRDLSEELQADRIEIEKLKSRSALLTQRQGVLEKEISLLQKQRELEEAQGKPAGEGDGEENTPADN